MQVAVPKKPMRVGSFFGAVDIDEACTRIGLVSFEMGRAVEGV